MFPFDSLVCQLEFAAWAIDGRFQDIQPYGFNLDASVEGSPRGGGAEPVLPELEVAEERHQAAHGERRKRRYRWLLQVRMQRQSFGDQGGSGHLGSRLVPASVQEKYRTPLSAEEDRSCTPNPTKGG